MFLLRLCFCQAMELEHRKLISDKSKKLSELINFDRLMTFIISKQIFTDLMIEDIYAENNDKLRKKKFFEELPTRGPNAFDSFIKALKMAGEEEAVKLLQENITGSYYAFENNSDQNKWCDLQFQLHDASNSSSLLISDELGNQEWHVQGLSDESITENSSDFYKMTSTPRGYCLIINNVDFNGLAEFRLGSDLDAQRLDIVFRELGYTVYLRRDLKAKAMLRTLYDFSKRDGHKTVDSCIVIILSHGSTGAVYGSDHEEVYVNDIIELFDNSNCPNLQGKPKLFFIQACRGNNFDSGVPRKNSADSPDSAGLPEGHAASALPNQEDSKRLSTVTDILISYSTIEGYISIRDHCLGSWYCQALCSVLSEYASKADLFTILRMVDREVKKRISSEGDKQATEINTKGWDKRFTFNVP